MKQCQNGLLDFLTPYRKQPRSTRNVFAYPWPAFLATKRINHTPTRFDHQDQVPQGPTPRKNTENYNTEVHDDGGLELVKPVHEASPIRSKPCGALKNAPGILPIRRSLLAVVGRKNKVVQDQFLPHKPPGSRLCFSHARVQYLPGSPTNELLSTLAEPDVYSPDKSLHGTLARAAALHHAFRSSASCLSRATTSRRTPNRGSKKAQLWITILNQPEHCRVQTDRLDCEDSQLVTFLEGESIPTPAGKTLSHSLPQKQFSEGGDRVCVWLVSVINVSRGFESQAEKGGGFVNLMGRDLGHPWV